MSASQPEVTVVVSTHNRRDRLERLLDALAEQTVPPERFEVIVVDDGSSDGTRDLLRHRLHEGRLRLRVIERTRASGPATARDEGWRAAAAPLIAFTDDDCEPTPRWLDRLLAAADRFPQDFLQGRTTPNPRELDAIGIFSRTVSSAGLGPWFETSNVAYPRGILEALDGFDRRFRNPGGEDTDLAWRAIESGSTPVYVEEATVYHAVNDLGPLGKLRVAMRWSDTMWIFRRHPPLRQLLHLGLFWKPSHAKALLALAGLGLARRFPPALILLLPYYREARGRLNELGGSRRDVPYLFLHDLLETASVARGAVRYRVPVI